MDSGYLEDGETLEDDYDVLRELLPGEVVGIIDQMTCYEVTLCSTIVRERHSDADGRFCRWHGIWAIHFLRPFLHPSTSTDSYGPSQKTLRKLALTEVTYSLAATNGYTSFFEHTVLA